MSYSQLEWNPLHCFIIRNVEITLRFEESACILHVPCHGVYVFTSEWAISSLPNGIDYNPDIYPPPLEDPLLIHDALFDPRPHGKTHKIKGVDITLDPFQMVISELKTNFKKWEIILSENAISLTGNKDHPNVCLCYMLATGKHFNLAYYMVNRMHVRVFYPHAFSEDLYLVDQNHSESTSSSNHQEEENDPINNFTLDPIPYIDQLPPIEGGESPEFKQTKGMFKCLAAGSFAAKLVPLEPKEPAVPVLQKVFLHFRFGVREPVPSSCTGRFHYGDGTAKNRATLLASSVPLH
ncbi:hypothetical protein Tco_0917288 [Tanacetum coccineum]